MRAAVARRAIPAVAPGTTRAAATTRSARGRVVRESRVRQVDGPRRDVEAPAGSVAGIAASATIPAVAAFVGEE